MNIDTFSNISASSMFLYAIIFCGCIAYFRCFDITLGTIIGIIVAIVFIYLIYHREITTLSNTEQLHETKAEFIHPIPVHVTKYKDLTDFVFSIQDFYVYNPQLYENMINAIDTFMEMYEDILLDNSLAGQYYENADTHKLLALNALHSIIIMIPPNKNLINKLNESMKTLETLLNKYLYEIYEKNKQFINENGYFNNSKVIDLKVAPYNKYKNEQFDQYY